MSKATELLELASSASSHDAVISESVYTAFSDINLDILPTLLEDVGFASDTKLSLDARDECLVIKINLTEESDRVIALNDTQRLFEDMGFLVGDITETSSEIELTLRT